MGFWNPISGTPDLCPIHLQHNQADAALGYQSDAGTSVLCGQTEPGLSGAVSESFSLSPNVDYLVDKMRRDEFGWDFGLNQPAQQRINLGPEFLERLNRVVPRMPY